MKEKAKLVFTILFYISLIPMALLFVLQGVGIAAMLLYASYGADMLRELRFMMDESPVLAVLFPVLLAATVILARKIKKSHTPEVEFMPGYLIPYAGAIGVIAFELLFFTSVGSLAARHMDLDYYISRVPLYIAVNAAITTALQYRREAAHRPWLLMTEAYLSAALYCMALSASTPCCRGG